jgi:hypothetical protein
VLLISVQQLPQEKKNDDDILQQNGGELQGGRKLGLVGVGVTSRYDDWIGNSSHVPDQ